MKILSKRILFHCSFYHKHFNYKRQSKKHYANNKRQLCIGKDRLNIGQISIRLKMITKFNRYLTDLTNNISF